MPVPAGSGRARPGRFPPSPACQRGVVSPARSCQQAGSPRARVRMHAARAWHGMAGQGRAGRPGRAGRAGRQAGPARQRRQAGRQPGPARPAPTFAPGGVQARARGGAPGRHAPAGMPRPITLPPPAGMPWSSSCPGHAPAPGRQACSAFSLFFQRNHGAGQGQAGGACGGGFFCAGVTAGKLRGDLFRVAGSYGRYTVRCNGASWGAGSNA